MKIKRNSIGAILVLVICICIMIYLPLYPPVFKVILHPPLDKSSGLNPGRVIFNLLDQYFLSLRADADFMVHAGGDYHRVKISSGKQETRWPVASLSKQFTGYLAARLVSKKKLSWDDKLSDRIYQFGNKNLVGDVNLGNCTIDQLSRHSSGIDAPESISYWRMTFFDREDHSERFLEHALRYCTRTRGESIYSDYNYTLLRLVIDSIGKYDDCFNREIHETLGLKNIKLELRNGTSPVSIRGYYCLSAMAQRSRPVAVPMPAWNISMLKGAVGVSATVSDLYNWYRYLREIYLQHTELSDEYYPREVGSYRNGLTKTLAKDGTALFHHGGLVPGFSSFVIMDFERDFFVVYLSAVSVWKTNYNIDMEIIDIIKGNGYRTIQFE